MTVGTSAVDFGDLTGNRGYHSTCSNGIRGVFCGGLTSSAVINIIEYVTIVTTMNSVDFGDTMMIDYFARDACSGT